MPNPSDKNQPTDMTYIETDEEVRKALHARLRAAAAGKPQPVATPAAPAAPVTADAQPERPSQRPPMALLCVLDDGKSDGEWVRLRADRTVIGKTEGDIRVPHDGLMSSLHAEITRVQGPNGYRWLLTDLRSINGTFVRIGGTALRSGTEFLVGGGRYRFEMTGTTATLLELTGAGKRFMLNVAECWIGRDARSCGISRPNDTLANARHVRLHRDGQGQWHVENNNSLNGLWLRVELMPLDTSCQFRLGEQRFLFCML